MIIINLCKYWYAALNLPLTRTAVPFSFFNPSTPCISSPAPQCSISASSYTTSSSSLTFGSYPSGLAPSTPSLSSSLSAFPSSPSPAFHSISPSLFHSCSLTFLKSWSSSDCPSPSGAASCTPPFPASPPTASSRPSSTSSVSSSTSAVSGRTCPHTSSPPRPSCPSSPSADCATSASPCPATAVCSPQPCPFSPHTCLSSPECLYLSATHSPPSLASLPSPPSQCPTTPHAYSHYFCWASSTCALPASSPVWPHLPCPSSSSAVTLPVSAVVAAKSSTPATPTYLSTTAPISCLLCSSSSSLSFSLANNSYWQT